MDALHPFFAIAAFAVAWAFAWVASRVVPLHAATGRAVSIDGLRGFLAYGVFVHHLAIWWVYAHEDRWDLPRSNLYTHLGESAVIVFFMITSFLFTAKLIASRTRPIAWRVLYLGRAFRIVPLYLTMFVGLVLIVMVLSNWRLQVEPGNLAGGLIAWASLAVFGLPDLNGVARTSVIVAGVPWTLKFELLFYLALPISALLMRRKVSWLVLGCSFVAVAGLTHVVDGVPRPLIVAFIGGAVAALLVESSSWVRFAGSPVATACALVSIVLAVTLFDRGIHSRSTVLFAVFFCILCGGNDLFGLLRSKAAVYLGEISFGIYLFHGIVLFVLMYFVIGPSAITSMSAVRYWTTALAAAPVVLLLAGLGYHFVERPAMAAGRSLATSLFGAAA